MESRRGGRVQVNMLQYHELVQRVERLEALVLESKTKKVGVNAELTNSEIKEMLDNRQVQYTTKSTKAELLALLEGN